MSSAFGLSPRRSFAFLVCGVSLVVLLLVSVIAGAPSASAQDEPAPAPADTTPAPAPTQPPATEPPATQPPASQPPTTQAPAPAEDDGSGEQPPSTDAPIRAGEGEPGVGDIPNPDESGPDQPAPGDSGEQPGVPGTPSPSAPRYSAAELIELQEKYDEAVGDEAEALAIWELANQRLAEIEARSSRLTGMLAWTELELQVARADHDKATMVREQTEEELARVQAELTDENLRLKRQAVEAFMGGSASNENILSTVLNAESIDEVESLREYAHVALDDQEGIVTSIEALEVRVDELLVAKNSLERQARVTVARVETFEAQVEGHTVELDALRILAEQEEIEMRRQLADIQTVRTEFEQRLNAIQQDSDSASAALQRSQANQAPGPPPRLHPPLLVPAISSGFGPRLHPIWGNVRMHNGLDYGGRSGDEIFAAAAGVVVMAEARGGYGNVVVIDHGNQWGTLYAHQSQMRVVPGQQVARGEVVGWVGSTGHSTGPHLHFELRQFGAPRDPINHIDTEEEHPVTCEVLIRTGHINDLDEAQRRDDCAEYFEQD